MKSMKCFKAAMMFALGALVFTACDDDDNRLQVPEAVQGAFTQKYGNETRVEWDMEKQYAVAEFWKDNREHDAWFTMDGAWLMTEVDYGRQIADLPQSVQDGFNASQYAQWTIDDIDKIERNNYEDVYNRKWTCILMLPVIFSKKLPMEMMTAMKECFRHRCLLLFKV